MVKDMKFGVELPTLTTNDRSLAAGSPFFGLQDKRDTTLDVITSGVESFLQHVVVSLIALISKASESLWLSDVPITALLGASIYYVGCLLSHSMFLRPKSHAW
ncbi:hypothetical protein CKAH01_12628 [Colletotrichum kahawae]|uniref:Uncharacterized protein n=1 Tax=Colletotrichum kahawae TaxID=34407 RepID=A0AAE0DCK4_COLKA|nr:hypothetical protein CKAH01_12628 [Colletotrichum kahawae]